MDVVDKYLITEKGNILKTLRFWKDILLVLDDIQNLRSARVSPEKKQETIERNIGLIRHLLKKNKVEPLYRDMITAGVEVALQHAGYRGHQKAIR